MVNIIVKLLLKPLAIIVANVILKAAVRRNLRIKTVEASTIVKHEALVLQEIGHLVRESRPENHTLLDKVVKTTRNDDGTVTITLTTVWQEKPSVWLQRTILTNIESPTINKREF